MGDGPIVPTGNPSFAGTMEAAGIEPANDSYRPAGALKACSPRSGLPSKSARFSANGSRRAE
jgi:hypothetical protein